jgi:quinol monooxygenase YgiN
MGIVRLTGQLICKNAKEAAIVAKHVPTHISLTLAERGCITFTVRKTDNPLIWQVDESFVDQTAFDAHQARTAGSEWAAVSKGIERRFTIAAD